MALISGMASSKDEYPVNMTPYREGGTEKILYRLSCAERLAGKNWLNIPVSFDTENSSFRDNEGSPVGLNYIWMFGVGEGKTATVIYGRWLEEFRALTVSVNEFLSETRSRIICYVHFLKYDFSFIKKWLHWDTVFLHGNREPLYAVSGRIEFRDSLVLAGGVGLEYIGNEVLRTKIHKAVGDLDYELIRCPQTPLTKKELHYCEMDIRVLNQYIQEKIEDDGNISKIPYTNTGYVRNYVRNKCFGHHAQYTAFMDKLTLTPDAYLQCEKAFMGGAVGPNIKYVGQVIENVQSYDIKSSYPFVMVTRYFPMGYPRPVPDEYANANIESLTVSEKYCVQFTLELWDLCPKTDYCYPISRHKCSKAIAVREASGRVIYASYIKINCTELDYLTWKKFYTWELCRVSRLRIFPKGYLPRPIIESVLHFFHEKTTLDGVRGKEQAYMISKNMLNASYGMMVEKPVREDFMFSGEKDFYKTPPDYVKQVLDYNKKQRRFLYYPWGVWITAHARYRLYEAIAAVGEDYRYCDTDCIKFTGDHADYFKRANQLALEDLQALSARMNISMDYIAPRNPKGSQKFLGVWENEGTYTRFKTLGAKRYMVEENGQLKLTVAGTNKKSTLDYIKRQALAKQPLTVSGHEEFDTRVNTDAFEIFDSELAIPPKYAKRTTSTFVDTERSGFVTDYLGNEYFYTSLSGVYVEPASYSFSITDEMVDAIMWLTHDGHYTEVY